MSRAAVKQPPDIGDALTLDQKLDRIEARDSAVTGMAAAAP